MAAQQQQQHNGETMKNGEEFEEGRKYVAKEDVFFDDGREVALLHHVHADASTYHSPAAILASIDKYARTEKYLMNVGEDKGRIVTSLIARHKPAVMLELGGYVGYSAVLFGAAVRAANPSGKYYSLERNPEFAAVIMGLVNRAGLQGTVEVVVGSGDEGIRKLVDEGVIGGATGRGVDMFFLDHYKPAYTTDVKLCEELGLIAEGTVICADNVIEPGNPPYLEYVRSSVEEKRQKAKEVVANGGSGVDQRFKDKTANQYLKREGEAKLDTTRRGDPDIVYKSELMMSWEPSGVRDGVEVTRCVGRAS